MNGNGDGSRRRSAYAEQTQRDRESARGVGVHQAGGGSGIADFFSKENRYKPITRGEFLGWLELLEYSRKSSVWWRRAGRWLTRRPGMQNLPAQMAGAYWRGTLKPALDAIQAELDQNAARENEQAKPSESIQ